MEATRTWPPTDLLAHIQELRKHIAADKLRYAEFRTFLKGYPEHWEVVAELLKARARYYRGEVIRAKNDVRRYALGEDPAQPSRYGEMVSDWATVYLDELPEEIRSLEHHWGESSGLGRTIVANHLWEADEQMVKVTIKNMQGVIKDFERITYGG